MPPPPNASGLCTCDHDCVNPFSVCFSGASWFDVDAASAPAPAHPAEPAEDGHTPRFALGEGGCECFPLTAWDPVACDGSLSAQGVLSGVLHSVALLLATGLLLSALLDTLTLALRAFRVRWARFQLSRRRRQGSFDLGLGGASPGLHSSPRLRSMSVLGASYSAFNAITGGTTIWAVLALSSLVALEALVVATSRCRG